MAQDWNIQSRGRVCAVGEEEFEDKQSIYSSLDLTEEGYLRRDVCETHWTDEIKQQSISYWKTVYHAPPPPEPEALKKETAETLLRQFMSREDFSRANVIFILAVMLERKRDLVERDVTRRDDGTKLRIYEHRKTGEIFTVPDPELRLDELEEVETEVQELLGIGPPRKAEVDPVPAEQAENPATEAPGPDQSTD